MTWRRLMTAAGLVLAACQPRYEELEIEVAGSAQVHVRTDEIRIPEGMVAAIRVKPVASGRREYEAFHLVEMTSRDETVLMVREGPELDMFVLVGVSVGETTVDVSIRNRDVDEIPSMVIAQ
jgi:hypothetical protein